MRRGGVDGARERRMIMQVLHRGKTQRIRPQAWQGCGRVLHIGIHFRFTEKSTPSAGAGGEYVVCGCSACASSVEQSEARGEAADLRACALQRWSLQKLCAVGPGIQNVYANLVRLRAQTRVLTSFTIR